MTSNTDVPQLLMHEGGLVAVNKPPGWLVHAGQQGQPSPIVGDWIQRELRLNERPAPIHRLDLETSGVVLFACDSATASEAGKAFMARDVAKTYIAVVHGRLRRKGIIRTTLRESGAAVEVVTRYRSLEWMGPYSLVSLKPEQGLKHQLRRQMHTFGHPIAGDDRHGVRHRNPAPPRLCLHARVLQWSDHEPVAAPLWPDLQLFVDQLRQRFPAAAAVEPTPDAELAD